jgi:hypothetical protein
MRSHRSSKMKDIPFGRRLFDGAMSDKRRDKLFEKSGRKTRHPEIHLRILQYMNIIHQKKSLAEEVSIMVESGQVTDEQMELVKRLMKDYGAWQSGFQVYRSSF